MTDKNNQILKDTYNDIYKKGKENFFTFDSIYVGEHLIKSINFSGKKVLDIGCGTGEIDLLIAKQGAKVLAIDYASEAIEIAKNKNIHDNLDFKLAEYKDIEEMFDIIISLGTVEHFNNPLEDLKKIGSKLNKGGVICFTCPSFLNVRGYVWMTLAKLFNVPMSLTDLHYICPFDVAEWAEELNMDFQWSTFNFDLGNNEKMIIDLKKRLPNALRDAGMAGDTNSLITWLEKVSNFDHASEFSGAMGMYILKKR